MNWRFTILDRNDTATVIEEPVGWDKNTAEIKRHPDYHGVFFTNQGETFEFDGAAMRLIKDEYDQYGFEGDLRLVMEEDCGNGYIEFSRGRFDFGKYEYYCGDSCYVKIPVERTGEVVELMSRINQKVNLETLLAFDETTVLPAYTKLPFDLSLPSKGIRLQNKALLATGEKTEVSLSEVPLIQYDTAPAMWNYGWFQVVPQIEVQKLNEFGVFGTAVKPENTFLASGFYDDNKAPSLYKVRIGNYATTTDRTLYFDWSSCTPLLYNNNNANNFANVSAFNLSVGYTLQFDTKAARIVFLNKVVLIRRKNGDIEILSNVQEVSATGNIASPGGFVTGTYWAPNTTHTVTESFTVSDITLHEGDYLFAFISGLSEYINTEATAGDDAYDITGTAGNVDMDTLSHSDPTPCKVFAVNETISRVVESITNNKLKGYSEYFGRTDSQPYALPGDGCGSLEVVTDGIRIRRQENKIPGKTNVFSLSVLDLFDGLSPIHNIGMGIEPDANRAGFNCLRVEPWNYFYNDSVIMSCTDISRINRKSYEKEAYSTFQYGYAKWEAEEFNGLDEFLTKRVGRTTLGQVKNDLIKLSKFVASGYAIEVTKRKGNIDSKDWRYDKETFIICCKRDTGDLVVELGNILNPDNIIDPDTIYNFRIRPISNAMRWMNRVFESYRQFGVDCKLLFTDGDGNYFAEGEMASPDCKLENGPIVENQTIDPSIYADTDDAKPFLLPERVTFDYPMSTKEYKDIEADPYGLVYFSSDCEDGYGYIDTIQYKPEEGIASFTLIPKAM